MNRQEIQSAIIAIFRAQFEIEDPGLDDDLRDAYEFDSIDAIELLREIEIMLGTELTRAEKKQAMEIRNLNGIFDYVEGLAVARSGPAPSAAINIP